MYRPFLAVAFMIYAGLAVGHVVRALTSTKFVIAGVAFPAWSSWPAAALALTLACALCWELTRERPEASTQ